ncbi:helix-turn-helix domain-containing protein [Rhodococcus sp. NPDC059234]|uniref:helix-turn-helix domain-containing protein n=1 Tax=Rhodococcus sp. NPDC059234 TaxID=3346781 RepID=UPI00366C185B
MAGVSDGMRALPAARLRPYLAPYEGYRLAGFEPGTHLGLPAPFLTVVVALDAPLEIASAAHPGQAPGHWDALASGIATTPVTIAHDGRQHGVQLSLTPAGARALLGVPTAALGAWIVGLGELFGADAAEIGDRIAATESWADRFAILDEVLTRRLRDDPIDPHLTQAWRLLVAGDARVGDVAREVGWSRRHLVGRFTAEFGVTPKDAARVARFHRSHQLMRARPDVSLADVAARCGYYDQAHLARDWRDLAGKPPSRWRAEELFTFVQDDGQAESALSEV